MDNLLFLILLLSIFTVYAPYVSNLSTGASDLSSAELKNGAGSYYYTDAVMIELRSKYEKKFSVARLLMITSLITTVLMFLLVKDYLPHSGMSHTAQLNTVLCALLMTSALLFFSFANYGLKKSIYKATFLATKEDLDNLTTTINSSKFKDKALSFIGENPKAGMSLFDCHYATAYLKTL